MDAKIFSPTLSLVSIRFTQFFEKKGLAFSLPNSHL